MCRSGHSPSKKGRECPLLAQDPASADLLAGDREGCPKGFALPVVVVGLEQHRQVDRFGLAGLKHSEVDGIELRCGNHVLRTVHTNLELVQIDTDRRHPLCERVADLGRCRDAAVVLDVDGPGHGLPRRQVVVVEIERVDVVLVVRQADGQRRGGRVDATGLRVTEVGAGNWAERRHRNAETRDGCSRSEDPLFACVVNVGGHNCPLSCDNRHNRRSENYIATPKHLGCYL